MHVPLARRFERPGIFSLWTGYMPTVMFVCTANLCRSPIAEVLFKQWLQQHTAPGSWHVQSCGTWAQDGEPVALSVLPQLLAVGIDLSHHRTRTVTAELMAESDLVLCMTSFHKEALQAEFHQYAARVHLLSEMIMQHYDIPDVSRVSADEYLVVAKDLMRIIERGAPRIIALLQSAADSD
jgi:protein-tyrosine-phosphatase